MRASGVLLPIASLPSKYGIGSFSKNAYKFIDQLKLGTAVLADTSYRPNWIWRFSLPIFSTFAGNPYFIDLDQLIEDGLLTKKSVMSVTLAMIQG